MLKLSIAGAAAVAVLGLAGVDHVGADRLSAAAGLQATPGWMSAPGEGMRVLARGEEKRDDEADPPNPKGA